MKGLYWGRYASEEAELSVVLKQSWCQKEVKYELRTAAGAPGACCKIWRRSEKKEGRKKIEKGIRGLSSPLHSWIIRISRHSPSGAHRYSLYFLLLLCVKIGLQIKWIIVFMPVCLACFPFPFIWCNDCNWVWGSKGQLIIDWLNTMTAFALVRTDPWCSLCFS